MYFFFWGTLFSRKLYVFVNWFTDIFEVWWALALKFDWLSGKIFIFLFIYFFDGKLFISFVPFFRALKLFASVERKLCYWKEMYAYSISPLLTSLEDSNSKYLSVILSVVSNVTFFYIKSLASGSFRDSYLLFYIFLRIPVFLGCIERSTANS